MTRKEVAGWGIAGVAALVLLTGHKSRPTPTNSLAPATSMASSDDGSASAPPIVDDSAVKGGETFTEYDERRDALNGSAGYYDGDGCTQDCSGHDAGYQWAQAHDIDDPDDCGGNSWSFEEGVPRVCC